MPNLKYKFNVGFEKDINDQCIIIFSIFDNTWYIGKQEHLRKVHAEGLMYLFHIVEFDCFEYIFRSKH